MLDYKFKSKKIVNCFQALLSKAQDLMVRVGFYRSCAWNHIKDHSNLYGLGIGALAILVAAVIFCVQYNKSEKTSRTIEDVKITSDATSLRLEKIEEKFDLYMKKMEELNRFSISSIQLKKSTPPLKIFSEEPYGEFSCFDYVIFQIVKENED